MIRIEIPFDRQAFINSYKLRWKLLSRGNYKGLLIHYLAAALLIIVAQFGGSWQGGGSYAFVFGIIFLLLAFRFSYNLLSARRRYFDRVRLMTDEYEREQWDCAYEFSEASVKYQDIEKQVDYQWRVFTGYAVYKDHLLLYTGDPAVPEYILDKIACGTEKYKAILELTSGKLSMSTT